MSKETAKTWRYYLDRYKYLALVVLAGVALLMLPSGSPESATGPPLTAEHLAREAPSAFSAEAAEKRIQEALGQIAGVGRVRVLLTVAGSPAVVYAENERSRIRGSWADGLATSQETDTERQVVMSSSSGVTAPVTESLRYPDFVGALVICDGAGDPSVKLRVAEAVSRLTGLTFDKIAIAPMKNGEE
jgi:stage III sporulation protein AG